MAASAKNFDWKSLGFDFGNWEDKKLWSLDLPVIEIDIKDLMWHFDVPYWPNDSDDRWTITPWNVINHDKESKNEQIKIEKAELIYPIDLFENKGKLLVLDGLHRLVKAYKKGEIRIKARIIPREKLPEIIVSDHFELPDC